MTGAWLTLSVLRSHARFVGKQGERHEDVLVVDGPSRRAALASRNASPPPEPDGSHRDLVDRGWAVLAGSCTLRTGGAPQDCFEVYRCATVRLSHSRTGGQ